MDDVMNRRRFLAMSAGVGAGLNLALTARHEARAAEPVAKSGMKKALIVGEPKAEQLRAFKEAGFDGVEAGIVPVQQAEQCRKIAEELGMEIHSVLRGWAKFNDPDATVVAESIATTEDALRAAQAYGADTVLLVPCRIAGNMPRPWEYRYDFDPATGHVRKVTYGDNEPFAEYIKAHNHAIDTSRQAIERLIPLAEKTGVVICVENVWNNLWVRPEIFRHFVASFKSKWVQAYYDIGNHVKYARSTDWILELGGLIAKCHVKDFLLNASDPAGGRKFVNIRDGSVRWPAVREALARVGYDGWMTIEGGDLSPEEHSKRLDLIIAGQ